MAKVDSIPAPVGGWNVKDALADMPEHHASILDNWFPGEGRVSIRPGFTEYATGLGGNVETLAELNTGATRKFLAAANGNWWNITASGAGVSLGSGYSNNRWDTANMDGKIGMVNGADTPVEWDGTTYQTLTITGVTSSTLIGINVFSGRSYFWADNDQSFWYSAVNALGGSLTEFHLSRTGAYGGKLLAMDTWTIDAGDGVDDLAVFFMSSGETIVYSGTDPSSFSLIGVFRIGEPVSIRGVTKLAADLAIISSDGYLSAAGALRQARLSDAGALNDQINPAATSAVKDYGDNFGWQAFHYPAGNMLIFNIPVAENTTYNQHVFNTNTGAPCRFKGVNARCWGLYNDKAYFGGNGSVYLFNDGFDDNGLNIDADAHTASTYLGDRSKQKHVTGVQPVMISDGEIAISIALGSEYATPTVAYKEPTFEGGASDWDTADWDTAAWSSGGSITKDWLNRDAFGYAISARVKVRAKGQLVKWPAINYMSEYGGLT